MKTFVNVEDIGDLKVAVKEALEVKANRFGYKSLGENKTLLMVFFNSSLRTRLSTQKAAMNLGMNVIVLDVNQGAWKLETERGVIMDSDKSEHLLEAIPVMGSYCDVIGVRSFARFVCWNHPARAVIRPARRGRALSLQGDFYEKFYPQLLWIINKLSCGQFAILFCSTAPVESC